MNAERSERSAGYPGPVSETSLEVSIREAFDRGDLSAAATRTVEGYGPEVLGYLFATVRDERADEVFAQACEDLWRGLPDFGWRCSMRTFFYAIARHAMARLLRSPAERRDRRVSVGALDGAVEHARTETAPWRQTAVKDRFTALREELQEDDRSLLVLRVDRRLPWEEIARVFTGVDADDDALRRESARLRKRFQLVRERLRRRAVEEGLVPASPEEP